MLTLENKMKNKTWQVVLEEDPSTGELILPFPQDFCLENDWRVNDTLEFLAYDNLSCIVTNISWEDRQRKDHMG